MDSKKQENPWVYKANTRLLEVPVIPLLSYEKLLCLIHELFDAAKSQAVLEKVLIPVNRDRAAKWQSPHWPIYHEIAIAIGLQYLKIAGQNADPIQLFALFADCRQAIATILGHTPLEKMGVARKEEEQARTEFEPNEQTDLWFPAVYEGYRKGRNKIHPFNTEPVIEQFSETYYSSIAVKKQITIYHCKASYPKYMTIKNHIYQDFSQYLQTDNPDSILSNSAKVLYSFLIAMPLYRGSAAAGEMFLQTALRHKGIHQIYKHERGISVDLAVYFSKDMAAFIDDFLMHQTNPEQAFLLEHIDLAEILEKYLPSQSLIPVENKADLEENVQAILSKPEKISFAYLKELCYDSLERKSNGRIKKKFPHSLGKKEWYQLTGELSPEFIKSCIEKNEDLRWVLSNFSNRKTVQELMLLFSFDELKGLIREIPDIHFAAALPLERREAFLVFIQDHVKSLLKDASDLYDIYTFKYSIYYRFKKSFIASLTNDYLKILLLENKTHACLMKRCLGETGWNDFMDSWDDDFLYMLVSRLSNKELNELCKLPFRENCLFLFLEKGIRNYLSTFDSFSLFDSLFLDEKKIAIQYLHDLERLKNRKGFQEAGVLTLEILNDPKTSQELRQSIYKAFDCRTQIEEFAMQDKLHPLFQTQSLNIRPIY